MTIKRAADNPAAPNRSIHAGDIIHALNNVSDFLRLGRLHRGYRAIGTALGRCARVISVPWKTYQQRTAENE